MTGDVDHAWYDEWERSSAVLLAETLLDLDVAVRCVSDVIEHYLTLSARRYGLVRVQAQMALLRIYNCAIRTGDADAAVAVLHEHLPLPTRNEE